ncbi:MAG: sugar phosphate nucleotidyltransferase, partial [Pseudomonadota bacterium]
MTTIRPVILCGGAGTRLWPLSSSNKPKQFHNLLGQSTMLT